MGIDVRNKYLEVVDLSVVYIRVKRENYCWGFSVILNLVLIFSYSC